TNNQWNSQLPAHEVVQLRRLVHDLIHGDCREVHELELDYATHAANGKTDRKSHGGGFAQRAVSHAIRSKFGEQIAIDAECAAIGSNVLPEQDQIRLTPHFLAESLIQSISHCQ